MNARISPGLLALVLFVPCLLGAAPPPARIIPILPVGSSPITPDCRWLFVVDTSSAMQRQADGLHRTVHRLVATGLGGRMRDGDVFTLWTYADTVLTREYPLNAWTPELNVALANRTHEFLQRQKFRGKSNLRPVFAELSQAIAISTNLTIIIVSDGTDVIVGTPFDRAINVTYGKRASEMRTAKMPFVTSLVTQRGEFTAWTVRGGLEDVGLPFRDISVPTPQALPLTSPTVVLATNKPATIAVTTNPAPQLPLPSPVAPKLSAAATNTAATVRPLVPKPAEPSDRLVRTNASALVPNPPAPRGFDPVPAPAPMPMPAQANTPSPVPEPKQETKAASPPPSKPAVAEAPKPAAPAPKPAVSVMATNVSVTPMPASVPVLGVSKSMPEVQPKLPSVIPPALRQPKSAIESSNALAKVELLRPPVTNLPAAKPLEARVVAPAPAASPRATNPHVIVAKAPAPSTNLVPIRLTTNASVNAPVAPQNISVTPPSPPAPKPLASKPPEQVVTRASNPPPAAVAAKVNVPPAKTNAAPATRPTPSSPSLETNAVLTIRTTNAPGNTNQPVGQLAVAETSPRRRGWAYLAAAVALLVLAGAIIAHLLRPRPHPSVISQSLDDGRL